MSTNLSPPDLTHVWLEASLFPETLAMFPEHVTVLWPETGAAVPYGNALPAQAIIASSLIRYDAELLDRLPNLKMIARTGIGVDNIDLQAATARNIVVTNTPDGPTESTAEHTVAMLLALAKRLKQGNANLAAGNFGPRAGGLVGTEVRGKTLGLIGLGRIGRRVAAICRLGLEMKVLAFDPFVSYDDAASLGVQLTGLDQVVQEADFISLHVPSTPETRCLINRERIAQMKDGVYVLNLARGSLLDEDALLEALEMGKLAGVGLDVFAPEPPDVASPLRDHPSVVATPHIASLTRDGRIRMEKMAVERVLAYFSGSQPADLVNPAALEA